MGDSTRLSWCPKIASFSCEFRFRVCLVLSSSAREPVVTNLRFFFRRELDRGIRRHLRCLPPRRHRTDRVRFGQKTNFDFRFRQLNRCCESPSGLCCRRGAFNERHSILEGAIASQECSAGLGSVWWTCPGRPRRRRPGRDRGARGGRGGPPGLPGGRDRPPMCVKRADQPSSFIFGVIPRLEWKSMASTSSGSRLGHPGRFEYRRRRWRLMMVGDDAGPST